MSGISRADLVGVGLNATDTLISVPEHPARGSKVESSSVKVLPGGQVATAVIACQVWGLQTRYVGKLGDDAAAAVHRKEFARAGVETQITTASECASHQSFILVDTNGERTVVRRSDEKLLLQPSELKREWISNARALLVGFRSWTRLGPGTSSTQDSSTRFSEAGHYSGNWILPVPLPL